MASFAFYSTTSYEKLLFDNIIEKQSEKLTLYRGGGISDEEMKIYEKYKNCCIIREIFYFLSTSVDQEQAENFIKRSKSKVKALYFFEVPIMRKQDSLFKNFINATKSIANELFSMEVPLMPKQEDSPAI